VGTRVRSVFDLLPKGRRMFSIRFDSIRFD
jgi:hypothetical protein